MKNELTIKPFQPDFHKADSFREQIGVLYPAGMTDDGQALRLIRSWEFVCKPGRASFSPSDPGSDNADGWQWIDDRITNNNVRGICHTHPGDFLQFSAEDIWAHNGFAKANGKMFLWHVLHACDVEDRAYVIAMHMPIPELVITYNLGYINAKVDDPVIEVPLPMALTFVDRNHIVVDQSE